MPPARQLLDANRYNGERIHIAHDVEKAAMISGSELVGARGKTLVGQLPAERLVRLWNTITSGVVKRGFALEYRDLEPPRTGIFDGLKIVIDPDVEFEMQCFVLLHLFGHSVQWVAPTL